MSFWQGILFVVFVFVAISAPIFVVFFVESNGTKKGNKIIKNYYKERIHDLRTLWDGNKIICEYGERFIYIQPNSHYDQLKGYYKYIISSNEGVEDSLLFLQTVKHELCEIRYKCKYNYRSPYEFKVPNKDHKLLKKIFNYLRQRDMEVLISQGSPNGPIPIPNKKIDEGNKDRFDILDFNK